MSRLSIRLRVTLVFAAVMALVLGAVGLFVCLRFERDLDNTINAGLEARSADIAALVRSLDSNPRNHARSPVGRTESFAQVLGSGGVVTASSEAVGRTPLLSPAEVRRAQQEALVVDRDSLPGLPEKARLLAVPVSAGSRTDVIAVGTSIAARDESLADLRELLLIGGPIALLLASVAAYWVAAAALRPVEAMRARAAQISAARPGQRLPVPPSHDEVGRLGTTLNEMLERLAEAFEREQAFVADASHELRTPLAILRTELELALAEGRTPDELRAALSSAAEETDRVTQLSEDLLTIAQTERGELPLQIAPLDLAELLNGVGERFSRRARDGSRAVDVGSAAFPIEADRLRLDQAVGNMVDNALRHGDGDIELGASRDDGSVEIHVLDRGPGFSEEFLEQAFKRFSRASASDRDGGSGLGLAIVQTIARAHGGDAHAANRAGGGADVWLSLPAGG